MGLSLSLFFGEKGEEEEEEGRDPRRQLISE
jgi:hypothetical protein